MKFGIYNGNIVGLGRKTNNMIVVTDDHDSFLAPKGEVKEIEDFKGYEREFTSIKEEIKSLIQRIGRLDSEYFKKSEVLKNMLMDARKREMAITSKILDSIRRDG